MQYSRLNFFFLGTLHLISTLPLTMSTGWSCGTLQEGIEQVMDDAVGAEERALMDRIQDE